MSAAAVVVVGDVMVDIVVVPEGPIRRGSDRRASISRRPGGSGANQAVWLASLGIQTRLLARVGGDDAVPLRADFAAVGVDARLGADPERGTGALICLVDPDGERSFLTDRGANLALDTADLPESLLDGAGLLLVSGYSLFADTPRRAVMALMARAAARGLTVAVDAASTGFLDEFGFEAFFAATVDATLLFANAEEAALLAGTADIEAQVRQLGARFTEVVIKRGAQGAMLGGLAGVRALLPAPAVAVVDTTGAGDAFAAGFIAARLDGSGPDLCLARGIALGAACVTFAGARPQSRR